jgi:(R,R)-butanediol dehydrogenase / meso-butanediol dehydrogenase / diacetyl reductase
MKAAVFKGKGLFEVEEIATPEPGPDELLIRIKYCGICGTDLHNYSFGITSPGSVIGHEWAGVVAEAGRKTAGFKPGDRVMLFKHPGAPLPPARIDPRAAYSAPGRRGAFAEYMVVKPSDAAHIPEGLTDEEAASLEPLVAGIHAVRLGNIKASDSVALIGAGPIGLFMLQRVKQAGARRVFVSEITPARAAKAAEFGADKVFNPLKDDIVSEIVKLTDGRGPDIVYECAADKTTLQQACKLVARNGRITCLAVYQEPITIDPLDWYMMQPEIKFTTNGDSTPFDWEISLELMRKKQIKVAEVVSHIVPLRDIQSTFQKLLNRETNTMLRVLVAP